MTGVTTRVGLWRLIGHEVRLFWRAAFMTKLTRVWIAPLVLFMVAVFAAFGWVAAQIVVFVNVPLTKAELIVSSGVGLVVFTLMLAQAVNSVMSAFYARGDLDLLLSSPVDPQTVVTARLVGVFFRLTPFYGGLALSTAIWGAIESDWRWWSWVGAIAGMAGLAVSGAVFATLAMMRSLGPRNARTLIQVLSALLGAAAFLAFQWHNFSSSGAPFRDFGALAQQIKALPIPPDHWVLAPARALLGDPLAAAILLALGALSFIATCASMGRRFAQDAAAIAAMGEGKTAAPRAANRPFRAGRTVNMIFKEWRLIRRDPMLLSQILLQLIYLAPLIFVVGRSALQGQVEAPFLVAAAAGVFAVIAAALAGALTWVTVSTEQAADLLTAAPIDAKTAQHAKIIAAVAPVVCAMAIPFGLLATFKPVDSLLAYLCCVAASVSASLIGVRFNKPGDRSKFNRGDQHRATWVGVIAHGFVGGAFTTAASLAGAGLWPIALIPALIGAGLLAALTEEPSVAAPENMSAKKAWWLRPFAPRAKRQERLGALGGDGA